MATILDELEQRDLVAQSTDADALRRDLAAGPLTLYCGFDPTAASLHVGHLVQVLTLRRFQQAGHRVIGLVGGATGLIGDPSFKAAERSLNEADVVAGWVERLRDQLARFLDFGGGNPALLANNLDWTGGMSAITLLRDVGKHFSVNQMLARESVRARLETGISYTEFSYVLLQSLDYLELHRRHGCRLQIGGSDQWGNITAGLDLIRRVEGTSAHALTTPLLTKADGTKFGKTETGTLWLDPAMTSPYAFYQFWVNTDDRDVVGYLKAMSFRSLEELEALAAATRERPQAREAQRALAEELTALVHGDAQRDAVVAASDALFGRGDLDALDEATLEAALAELPCASAPAGPPLSPIVNLLVDTGLAESNSNAKRLIRGGGVKLNNHRVQTEDQMPSLLDLLHGRFLVLRRGKKNLAAVEVDRTPLVKARQGAGSVRSPYVVRVVDFDQQSALDSYLVSLALGRALGKLEQRVLFVSRREGDTFIRWSQIIESLMTGADCVEGEAQRRLRPMAEVEASEKVHGTPGTLVPVKVDSLGDVAHWLLKGPMPPGGPGDPPRDTFGDALGKIAHELSIDWIVYCEAWRPERSLELKSDVNIAVNVKIAGSMEHLHDRSSRQAESPRLVPHNLSVETLSLLPIKPPLTDLEARLGRSKSIGSANMLAQLSPWIVTDTASLRRILQIDLALDQWDVELAEVLLPSRSKSAHGEVLIKQFTDLYRQYSWSLLDVANRVLISLSSETVKAANGSGSARS